MSGKPSSLAGNLLLAVPSMRDPTFARAVVFMAAHTNKEGAFGYVLNRPLEQRVADLLPDQSLGALGHVSVYMGGPVATDKLVFASLRWNRKAGTLRCQTHLSIADALHELKLGHDVRGFVGYSGWSRGQIEDELRKHSWIISPAVKHILSKATGPQLWSEVMEDLGPVFHIMAHTPEDIELN
jgi:putative transcriptional regulator